MINKVHGTGIILRPTAYSVALLSLFWRYLQLPDPPEVKSAAIVPSVCAPVPPAGRTNVHSIPISLPYTPFPPSNALPYTLFPKHHTPVHSVPWVTHS